MLSTTVETFRTGFVPSARRLAYWNDVAITTFGDIAIDAAARQFDASMQRRRLGELTLVDVTSAPARVWGGSSARSDGWFLVLNERGTARVLQCGRDTVLAPGELTALHANERYRIEFSQRNRCLVLRMPNVPRNVDIDAHVARRHACDEAVLLRELMRRLAVFDEESSAPVSFARLALDLAALTWPARKTGVRSRSMSHWRERALDVVARRHDEPDLDATVIARELGVSRRFVHMIFASIGRTPADYILDQRLERAADALRAHPTSSITDIALRAGFRDLSRFCRTFRRRYGVSARRYRAS